MPVGGGGLISGVAFAIKSLKPEVKVYGVQAEGAPSMYRSLHEHKYQTLSAVSTFADGIQVKTPGELTYKLSRSMWTTSSLSPRTRPQRPSSP